MYTHAVDAIKNLDKTKTKNNDINLSQRKIRQYMYGYL